MFVSNLMFDYTKSSSLFNNETLKIQKISIQALDIWRQLILFGQGDVAKFEALITKLGGQELLLSVQESWETHKVFLASYIDAIVTNDVAIKSKEEAYLYGGFTALSTHLFSHLLYTHSLYLEARASQEYIHQLTGIDIHPGAQIGQSVFIDHGTGIVIGETAEVHDYVKIYHGVTLGTRTLDTNDRNKKRHPTILANASLFAGSSILGNITIGQGSIVGANAKVTKSSDNNQIIK